MRKGRTHPPETTRFSWSRDHEQCQNCGTTRRNHYRRGLCGPCWYSDQQIKLIRNWDRSKPATLKGIGAYITDGLDDGVFERFRGAWAEEFKMRLGDLKRREQRRKGHDVDGMTVERQLQHLMTLIGKKKRSPFYNRASSLRRHFDNAELVALYCLIDDIIETIPWKPDFGRAWKMAYEVEP